MNETSNITCTAASSATQMAAWTSADGLARVYVARANVRDDRGAMGWSYHVSCPTETEGVRVGYTFADPRELIYTPMNDSDPRPVLDTLASFLSAWAEALDYPDSDNRDLFPAAVAGIVDYVDELQSETIVWEQS